MPWPAGMPATITTTTQRCSKPRGLHSNGCNLVAILGLKDTGDFLRTFDTSRGWIMYITTSLRFVIDWMYNNSDLLHREFLYSRFFGGTGCFQHIIIVYRTSPSETFLNRRFFGGTGCYFEEFQHIEVCWKIAHQANSTIRVSYY